MGAFLSTPDKPQPGQSYDIFESFQMAEYDTRKTRLESILSDITEGQNNLISKLVNADDSLLILGLVNHIRHTAHDNHFKPDLQLFSQLFVAFFADENVGRAEWKNLPSSFQGMPQ